MSAINESDRDRVLRTIEEDKRRKQGDLFEPESALHNGNYIDRHLATPPQAPGGRHADILSLSLQMVGEGFPDREIFQTLRNRYPDKEKTDKEINDAIAGAHRKNPQPACLAPGGNGGNGRHHYNGAPQKPEIRAHKHDGSAEPLPDEIPLSFCQFLRLVLKFREDEYVWLAGWEDNPDDPKKPRFTQDHAGEKVGDLDRPIFEGMSRADSLTGNDDGAYFCINPFKSAANRKGENVSRFMYTLLDNDRLPKGEQLAVYRKLDLPIAALIDTGGRSLHAIVKIDAPDAEEYKRRVGVLHERLKGLGFDATKDAPRFARVPNCPREQSRQRLVSVACGALTWQEWEESLPIDDGKRQLTGHSPLYFARRPINHENTLLGNRWLCRGGGAFAVAPSGQGKSVFANQAAIEWSCGRTSFGIKPARALRVLIIQAEDDEDDITEMAQVVYHLKLSPKEQELVNQSAHIEFLNDAIGDSFLTVLDGFLGQFAADLVLINPYTSYLGGDTKDEARNTLFLRNGLNPILTKHRCAALIVHHTPKTNFRDTSGWKPSDWMYAGSGAAVLTNWARAYLVIDQTGVQGVYKFIAAKRGKRIGWGDHFPVCETFWSHSNDGKLLWVPATAEEVAATARTKGNLKADDLLEIVPVLDPVIIEQIMAAAKEKWGLGAKKVREFVKVLVADAKIHVHNVKRQGARAEVKYAKMPVIGSCE